LNLINWSKSFVVLSASAGHGEFQKKSPEIVMYYYFQFVFAVVKMREHACCLRYYILFCSE